MMGSGRLGHDLEESHWSPAFIYSQGPRPYGPELPLHAPMHPRLHSQPGKLSLPCSPSRSASRNALWLQWQHCFFHDASSLPSWAGLSVAGRAGKTCPPTATCGFLADPAPVQMPTTSSARVLGGRRAGGKVPPEASLFLHDIGLGRLSCQS